MLSAASASSSRATFSSLGSCISNPRDSRLEDIRASAPQPPSSVASPHPHNAPVGRLGLIDKFLGWFKKESPSEASPVVAAPETPEQICLKEIGVLEKKINEVQQSIKARNEYPPERYLIRASARGAMSAALNQINRLAIRKLETQIWNFEEDLIRLLIQTILRNPNSPDAIEKLVRLREKHHFSARAHIAYLYEMGIGVARNVPFAIREYYLAAFSYHTSKIHASHIGRTYPKPQSIPRLLALCESENDDLADHTLRRLIEQVRATTQEDQEELEDLGLAYDIAQLPGSY